MSQFGDPMVKNRGDESSPLVVLFRGRGSRETEIIGLADALPQDSRSTAAGVPIPERGGFAWFENRGIGKAAAQSLPSTMDLVSQLARRVDLARRAVFLVGYSRGAAFASALLLAVRHRYSGAAILYGRLPFRRGCTDRAYTVRGGTNVRRAGRLTI